MHRVSRVQRRPDGRWAAMWGLRRGLCAVAGAGLMVLCGLSWAACSCTALDCSHGINVGARLPGSAEFSPGTYRVVFEQIGGLQWETTCTSTTLDPHPTCGTGLDDSAGFHFQDPTLMMVYLRLRELPDLEAKYRVLIEQDGTPIVDHIIEAPFLRVYPNGESCGGACRVATETVSATAL